MLECFLGHNAQNHFRAIWLKLQRSDFSEFKISVSLLILKISSVSFILGFSTLFRVSRVVCCTRGHVEATEPKRLWRFVEWCPVDIYAGAPFRSISK